MKSQEHARAETTNSNKVVQNDFKKDYNNNKNKRDDANAAQDEPKKRKRMKGIELADALMLPRLGSSTLRSSGMPPLPKSVEAQVCMYVCMCV